QAVAQRGRGVPGRALQPLLGDAESSRCAPRAEILQHDQGLAARAPLRYKLKEPGQGPAVQSAESGQTGRPRGGSTCFMTIVDVSRWTPGSRASSSSSTPW